MLSTGTGQRKIAKIATVSKFATGMFGDLGGLADHVPLDLDRHFLFKKSWNRVLCRFIELESPVAAKAGEAKKLKYI